MSAKSLLDADFVFRRLEEREVSSYLAEGYLCLGRTLTDTGLQKLRNEVTTVWQAKKDPFDPGATWLKNALLNDIHHHSDTARRFYFSGPLVETASQIIGPNIKGATSQLTFKMRGNTMPFPWHQDNGYGHLAPYNTITSLTALDDADVENGCLWIIPGSHKHGQLEVEMTPEQKKAGAQIALSVDERNAIPVPMKAGESIIFSCWTLHKSEGNRSTDRDRRILFLRYADADAVEVYNGQRARLGRLLRGVSRFPEVAAFEAHLALD